MGDKQSADSEQGSLVLLYRRLGLTRVTIKSSCDENGIVGFELPYLQSQGVSVKFSEYSSDYVRVPTVYESWDRVLSVELSARLTSGDRVVRGVLRDDEGRPLAQQRIRLFTWRTAGAADVNVSEELARGEAFTLSTTSDGRTVVRAQTTRATDADGAFELRSRAPGKMVIVVLREGYLPLRYDVASTDQDQELTLRPAGRPAPLLVRHGGLPLRESLVKFADMSRNPQIVFEVRTDAHGLCSTDWLEMGVDYILLRPPQPGEGRQTPLEGRFTWSGQYEIDVSER